MEKEMKLNERDDFVATPHVVEMQRRKRKKSELLLAPLLLL
jgi:hypothetical protein